MSGPQIHALVPAAGHSVRFGGTTLKQYAHVLGRPVIAHTITAVSRHPWIRSITVALAADDGIYQELVHSSFPFARTVTGGDCRARTVFNGLQSIRAHAADEDWVVVHDAARPCLSESDLQLLINACLASECGGILAIPVSDTLKLADESGHIESTMDRSRYWAAQTPQMFRLGELAENLGAALDAGETPTDEAAAMERGGLRPLLVQGSATNIKITGSEDLLLVDAILRHQLTLG